MRKIAIPADGNVVSQHFGHCTQFYIASVEGSEVKEKEFVDNPGHQPGFLPRFLNGLGVNCILAGGMGQRAVALFNQNNIEVVTGAGGPLDQVLEQYLNDSLETEENICDH
ncbi:MAG: NifB/NifX family molybdenum-iron cluster-binding protein [Halanaerobiales bacterium]